MIAEVAQPCSTGILHDAAAARFDDVAADDRVGGPVGAFDEHVRLDALDDLGRRLFVENHDGVDARQRGQDLRALSSGVIGRVGPL